MKKRAFVFILLLAFLIPGICISKSSSLFVNKQTNPLYVSDKIKIYGEVQGDDFVLRIVAKTLGSVGIGLGDTADLGTGDIILGYVDSTGVHTLDAYMNTYGYYLEDIGHGGRDDVVEAVGYESFGNTIIEFKRKFKTGDVFRNDSEITADEPLNFIWAISDSDDFTSSPKEGGYGTLSFNDPIDNYELYNKLYKILLMLGLLLLLGAAVIVSIKKIEKRLKLHKMFILFGLLTIFLGSFLLALAKGSSYKLLNIIMLLVFIAFVVATVIFALLTLSYRRKQSKEKQKIKIKSKFRDIHLTLGILTLIALITEIIIEFAIYGLFF